MNGITITINRDSFEMEDAFQLRQDAIDKGALSEELWATLTPEHQEVLTAIVGSSLSMLSANMDKWVPNCITGDGSDLVTVEMKILMSQIEENVEVIQKASPRHQAEQRVTDLEAELEAVRDEITSLEGEITSLENEIAHLEAAE